MACYFSLVAFLNDIDTEDKVLNFAMDNSIIHKCKTCPNCQNQMKLAKRKSLIRKKLFPTSMNSPLKIPMISILSMFCWNLFLLFNK